MNLRQIHAKDCTWVNVGTPGGAELSFVGKLLTLHPQDVRDALPPVQRPKLVVREQYLFLIFQFPVYNRTNRRIEPAEIDFFLSKDHLVVVHNSRLEPLNELFDSAIRDSRVSKELLTNSGSLMVTILETIFATMNPMLNHISLDIDSVEDRLLEGHNRQVIREILVVKRNIVNFRKIMQAHKSVIGDLAEHGGLFISPSVARRRIPDLIHTTIELWDSLKNYEDAINAIHDSHTSLVSVRQSEIIKTLTIISVLTFPLSLLAAVFGIDAKGGMPFLFHPQGFWIVVGILCAVALVMLLVFKRKKWI